jgi:hypothetical protein
MTMALTASLVHSQSELSLDERIAIVEKKIEGSAVRGDLTKSEYSRLKPRLAVVKYKRAKLEKDGVKEQSYKDLEHYLMGLEKDTDRLLKNIHRR